MEIIRLTYSTREAAQVIGVCTKTLSQMVNQGQVPCIRIGRAKVVFPKEALHQWIKDSVEIPSRRNA